MVNLNNSQNSLNGVLLNKYFRGAKFLIEEKIQRLKKH